MRIPTRTALCSFTCAAILFTAIVSSRGYALADAGGENKGVGSHTEKYFAV